MYGITVVVETTRIYSLARNSGGYSRADGLAKLVPLLGSLLEIVERLFKVD
jgi:hypothetical protein